MGYDETTVLSYVGKGGDYQAETTYKYVGKGAGEFEMVTVPTNIKPGYCYCVVAFLLVAVVVYLLNPSAPTSTTTPRDIIIPTTTPLDITTTSEPYCCKSKGLWSLDKKAWCCKHYGVGCPTAAPAPVPPPAPTPPPEPNCAIGTPVTWDMGKKVWCCAHHHIGCPTVAPVTTPCPYDCAAGFSNWQKGWSEGKKAFCCSTQGKGCPPTAPPTPPPPPAPTTSLPYDCNAGYHGCYHCLIKQWSVSKLAWCCQHMGRGCPTVP